MSGVPFSGPCCITNSILALGVLLEVSVKGCGASSVGRSGAVRGLPSYLTLCSRSLPSGTAWRA